MKGKLFLLMGPSGVGKTTLRRKLLNEVSYLKFIPSFTTRSPRDVNDKNEYNFLSAKEFEKLINEKFFLEWEKHYDNYYGIPESMYFDELNSGSFLVKEIDYNGLQAIKNSVAGNNSVSIYLVPNDITDLINRVNTRKEKSNNDRIKEIELHIQKSSLCDYKIKLIAGKINEGLEMIKSIITNELN